MDTERVLYRWRTMTPDQREAVLKQRQQNRLPWHGPPHYESSAGLYLITAASYEHQPYIGFSESRIEAFAVELLDAVKSASEENFAWVILPNHYHLLLKAPDLRAILLTLQRVHGRTSFQWNGEEGQRGRQVWHRAAETAMKSERHFWATLNYVLHNAVRHRYVERWQDWPYSNAAEYLAETGREVAERRWRDYPIGNYGDGWDPPEM